MKTYKTSSAGPMVISIITIIIFVVILLDSSQVDVWLPYLFLLILLFAIVDMKFGIYAGTKNGDFFETKHFIYRRQIKVSDIDRILYQPTWAFGQKMRSLYFIDRTNGKAKFKLTNGAYSFKTLATIIDDLRKENRSIGLDDPAQDLVRDYL